MRHLPLIVLFATACAPEGAEAPFNPFADPFAPTATAGRVAAPVLTLTGPAEVVPGTRATFTITGAAWGEPVYFGRSTAAGRPACLPPAGGLCLDLANPVQLAGVVYADTSGRAELSFTLPPNTPLVTANFQAVVIRGLRGVASIASNPVAMQIVSDIYGCTDPAASNYDPAATADDGSCAQAVDPTIPGYAGPAGPDLSAGGWTLCSGATSAATPFTGFYGPCAAFSAVRFACSVDADADAEYVSAAVPVAGAAFTDAVCDDWGQGSNSVYGVGRILSIDDSNPSCNQFDVSYDMYMDMVNGQWGCAGTINTHSTGGRMWMYGLAGTLQDIAGCTDPGANNYDPAASLDDGTCTYAGPTVPGFAGVLGPDLSAQGFFQCAGTSSGSTTSAQFYALCGGYSQIIFACSTTADSIAEFTSAAFPIAGQSLTDGVCDDWAGGSNSPYGAGHILSLDDTNPTCSQFDVNYDMYMDMVNGQWGCAGTINTHATGGRMWAYVR